MRSALTGWFLIGFFLTGLLHAQESYVRVAFDDGGVPGKQAHLLSGDNYTFPGLSADLDATVAFGEEVVFGYDGLVPDARYHARIVFVSDGHRVQSLFAGENLLKDRIELKAGESVVETIDLPAETFAKGRLFVRTQKLEGPNAVVASIEILSTDAKMLAPLPEPPVPDYVLPRLSPCPDSVEGTATPHLYLNGTWRFHPDPPDRFEKTNGTGPGWGDIEVPGQWTQQGYTVDKAKAAAYIRLFDLPADWSGKRIKLRCDAVYSDAIVYVNGQEAGRHLGGFTPFEIDITDLVHQGENTIAMAVKSHSLADTLASGIQYAAHDLGGIPRKLYLIALPEVNVARLHVETLFDDKFDDATLKILIEVANESPDPAGPPESAGRTGPLCVVLSLREDPHGTEQALTATTYQLNTSPPGASVLHEIHMTVPSPRKWHSETPNLYTLIAHLRIGRKTLQETRIRFGFRQVEVRGDELFVNGKPVKLHGVCRHEVNPLRGRSLTREDWWRDAELFKMANCNYIRTSHYPPAEEFIEACDALGLFVEQEAPLCWVGHGANKIWQTWDPHNDEYFAYIQQCVLEMIERDRSHPSVIVWSLANESAWGRNWKWANANAAAADPTRPRSFHDQCYGGYNNQGSVEMPVANMHYPGPGGPQKAVDIDRPLLFGEYCHLNAYNRHELVTDPGVRDAWGRGLRTMWEDMWKTKGILGGALWSGIDDSFFLPDGLLVGYGTWGPIDGWRRPKPEYWHVKKAYSPVKAHLDQVTVEDDTLHIPVENRHDALNLKDLKIDWTAGDREGTCSVDVPPRSTGTLEIPATDEDLVITVGNPRMVSVDGKRGFMIDEYRIPAWRGKESPRDSGRAGNLSFTIEHSTGKLSTIATKGTAVLIGGPDLMILPLDNRGGTQMTGQNREFAPTTQTCSDWKSESVKIEKGKDRTEISVEGAYAEAAGFYTLTLHDSGDMELAYSFTCNKEVNPRQIGMVFTLPAEFDNLSWKREGLWSAYPPDHIGRNEGKAEAFPMDVRLGPAGPEWVPEWPYSEDTNELGSNDFRSTKENIRWASLTDDEGRGFRVLSDARHHVRAWVDTIGVRVLVAFYNNPGAERFFRSHARLEDKPLKPGDTITDTVRFEVIER